MPSQHNASQPSTLSGGIFVALGANLPHPTFGPPLATMQLALSALDKIEGVTVRKHSRWYRSKPQPASDQPWYINGVAELVTGRSPRDLMQFLHEIEAEFGRARSARNAARTLDLDLIDYAGLVLPPSGDPQALILPHPRCHERSFVLVPLRELAPGWRHPVSGFTVDEIIMSLGDNSGLELVTGQGEPHPGADN